MPICRAGDRLIYFAHVPKCGGTTIERYLSHRFGHVAFHDGDYMSLPTDRRWSTSSPQHIHTGALARLFPTGFFDATFTVVRHPESRLVSVFHFQQEVRKVVAPEVSFSDWLVGLEGRSDAGRPIYDNHTRPMSDIVPAGARVFHLEHGLDGVVAWLDDLTGETSGARAIGRLNERRARSTRGPAVRVSEADRSRLVRLFADDYRRFGYAPDELGAIDRPPTLSGDFIAGRDAEFKKLDRSLIRATTRLGRRLGRRAHG